MFWERSRSAAGQSGTSTSAVARPDQLVADKQNSGTVIGNHNASSEIQHLGDDAQRKASVRGNNRAITKTRQDSTPDTLETHPRTPSRQASSVAGSRSVSPPSSLWRGLRDRGRGLAAAANASSLSVNSASSAPAQLDTHPGYLSASEPKRPSFTLRIRSRGKRTGIGPWGSAKERKQLDNLKLSPVESRSASTLESTVSSRDSTTGSSAADEVGTLRSQPSSDFSQRRVHFDEAAMPARGEKRFATFPRREASLRVILARNSSLSDFAPSPTASDAGDGPNIPLPGISPCRSPSPMFLRRRVASDTDVFFPAYPPLAITPSSPLARPTATHYFPPQANPRTGPPTTFHFQQPSPYPHPMSETVSRIHSQYLNNTVCVYPPLPSGNAAQKREWRANAVLTAGKSASPGQGFSAPVPEAGMIGGSGAGAGIFISRRRR